MNFFKQIIKFKETSSLRIKRNTLLKSNFIFLMALFLKCIHCICGSVKDISAQLFEPSAAQW